MPPLWTVICGIAAIIALVSEIANRRRIQRKDIDRVGFMPWPTITAMSLLTFGISLAFGLGFISTS
jgi:hypothetical protein